MWPSKPTYDLLWKDMWNKMYFKFYNERENQMQQEK